MSTHSAFSSRRSFLQQAAGVTAATAWGFQTCHASSTPTAKVIDTRVISKTPDLYCGWPTLNRRANGQLLLVYSGGRERHVCPFGRVDLMRSNDDGESRVVQKVVSAKMPCIEVVSRHQQPQELSP